MRGAVRKVEMEKPVFSYIKNHWREASQRKHSPFEDGLAAYNRGDYPTAMQIWHPLANHGHASAQLYLGLMYEKGHVSQDYSAALTWYRKAADQGDAVAQNNLGAMYANGYGVPQDYAAAVNWYRKAADQGCADAQFDLGAMYASGLGVPQDNKAAASWCRKAADQGRRCSIQSRGHVP